MSESKLGAGGKHGMGGRTRKLKTGHDAEGHQEHINTPAINPLDTTKKTANTNIGKRSLLDTGGGVSGV